MNWSQPSNLYLKVISGPQTGLRIPLTESQITVGRGLETDIRLTDDKAVSRVHAVIQKHGSSYFILDQQSTNGTYVNGKLVGEASPLEPEDMVRIGKTVFQVNGTKNSLNKTKLDIPIIHSQLKNGGRPLGLTLFQSPTDENQTTKKTKSIREFQNLIYAFPFVLALSVIAAHFLNPTASESIRHHSALVANSESTENETENYSSANPQVKSILRQYAIHRTNARWDRAFTLSIWALAFIPNSKELQHAVSESAAQLRNDLNLLQRRTTVIQTLQLAHHSYLNYQPIRVPLILTQALIDFHLIDGLTNEAELKKRLDEIHHLAQLEIEHQRRLASSI